MGNSHPPFFLQQEEQFALISGDCVVADQPLISPAYERAEHEEGRGEEEGEEGEGEEKGGGGERETLHWGAIESKAAGFVLETEVGFLQR